MSDEADRMVSVFGSADPAEGSPEYETARRVGEALAGLGYGVVNGGYGGTMAGSARGAAEAGGQAVQDDPEERDCPPVESHEWHGNRPASKHEAQRQNRQRTFVSPSNMGIPPLAGRLRVPVSVEKNQRARYDDIERWWR
ncbi:MAG: hypothetical protein NT031_08690 [Planctomycetota bacterium]|nr:hypothetical protein [Planctomycetota bacterium]